MKRIDLVRTSTSSPNKSKIVLKVKKKRCNKKIEKKQAAASSAIGYISKAAEHSKMYNISK